MSRLSQMLAATVEKFALPDEVMLTVDVDPVSLS
jgi:hypothetical protein